MRLKLWLALSLICWCVPGVAFSDAHEEDAVRCMALNLYWEARSEGREGMLAVGWVVLNRVAHPKFPNTVCGVIQQGGGKYLRVSGTGGVMVAVIARRNRSLGPSLRIWRENS